MDGKKEDAKCEGSKSSQAGLLAWLKAKLGIVKAMQASGEPAAFVTPENLIRGGGRETGRGDQGRPGEATRPTADAGPAGHDQDHVDPDRQMQLLGLPHAGLCTMELKNERQKDQFSY